jgi:hypothetical protein
VKTEERSGGEGVGRGLPSVSEPPRAVMQDLLDEVDRRLE